MNRLVTNVSLFLILWYMALSSTKFMLQTNLKQEIGKEHSCFKYGFVLVDYVEHTSIAILGCMYPMSHRLGTWLCLLRSLSGQMFPFYDFCSVMMLCLLWKIKNQDSESRCGLRIRALSKHQTQQYLNMCVLASRTVRNRFLV